MGRKMTRRNCKQCGATSDLRALCSICDPHKRTSPHWDKYDDKTKASAA